MGGVPHDVLVEVLERLIEPEPNEISKLERHWPFEVLYDAVLAHALSCASVVE